MKNGPESKVNRRLATKLADDSVLVGYSGKGIRVLNPDRLTADQKQKMFNLNVGRLRATLNALAYGMLSDSFAVWRMEKKGYPYYSLRGLDFSAVVTINPFLFAYILQDKPDASGSKLSVPLEAFRELVGVSSVSTYRLPGLPDTDIDSIFVHSHLRHTFAPDFTWKGTSLDHQELYKTIISTQASSTFNSIHRKLQESIEFGNQAEIDITELTTRYTLGVILEAFFGISDIDEAISRMHQDLTKFGKTSFATLTELKDFIRTLNKWVSTVSNFGSVTVAATVFPELKRTCELLSIKYGNFTTWLIQNAAKTHPNGELNLFGKLMEHHGIQSPDAELNKTNQEIIQGMVAGMTIVGFETTAIAIQNFLFRLQERPELLDSIQAAFEIGDENYIENLFLEECRLHPPVPRIARKLNQKLIIEDGEHVIELQEGTTLVYLVHYANRDRKVWGDRFDPEQFIPERWNEYRNKNGSGSLQWPAHYLVFGRGNTRCTGIDLALREFTEFLRQLVLNRPAFQLRLPARNKHDLQYTNWVIAEHKDPHTKAEVLPVS